MGSKQTKKEDMKQSSGEGQGEEQERQRMEAEQVNFHNSNH